MAHPVTRELDLSEVFAHRAASKARFEDQVERGFEGAPEGRKTRFPKDVRKARFSRLGAQHMGSVFGDSVGATKCRRRRVIETSDGVPSPVHPYRRDLARPIPQEVPSAPFG